MQSVVVLETLPRVTMSLSDFLCRFTQAERIAMRNSTVPEVVDVYSVLMSMVFINVRSEFCVESANTLVENGILTAERAVIILGDV
jgi:hypothetical protein